MLLIDLIEVKLIINSDKKLTANPAKEILIYQGKLFCKVELKCSLLFLSFSFFA